MSNILTRTIFGALFVAIVIGSFLIGQEVTAIVLGVFMAIGLNEFYQLFKLEKAVSPLRWFGIFGGIVLYLVLILLQLEQIQFDLMLLLILLIFIPFLTLLFSKTKNPIVDLGMTFFPWAYILLPFYLIFKIYQFDAGANEEWVYIIGFFILVWSNDSFAYLSGRFFGKHKLFERISPKKTWEGAIGGFIMTIVAGAVYATFTHQPLPFWMIAGILISPLSIFGDLIESKLKRTVNIKDSGNILPGHGGILDRFDAALFAAPFFYFFLLIYFQ